MRVGGELLTAILLRNDHAEEATLLDVLPRLRRQVLPDGGGFPVVREVAEMLALDIEKRLFFRSEPGGAASEQGVPVRTSREQRRVPPDRAGFDGIALGRR